MGQAYVLFFFLMDKRNKYCINVSAREEHDSLVGDAKLLASKKENDRRC